MFLDSQDRIADNRPRTSNGIAVTDVDGDGVAEVVVTGFAERNLVLKWDGERLVDTADSVLADPAGCALGVAAADVDGDGREEIYILNSERSSGPKDAGDRLFAGFGDRWLDLLSQTENAAVANASAGRSVAVIDRQGTGRYGFVVASDGAPFRLYELSRRGRISDMAEEAGIDSYAAGRGLLCMPLLSDRMDIFACNEAGPNFLFRNLGDGTFEEIAEERGLTDSRQAGRGAVALDADGDGLFDLLVANWEGSQRLFLQRTGAFADAANADLSLPARIGTVIAADFDNDGYEELFFNVQGDRNRLFAWCHEEWQEIDPGDAALPKGFGTGAAVADLDGDGRLELVVGHGGPHPQPLALFRPVPNGNHWLRVQPLTAHAAPARGAVVTCTAGGRRQIRAVCAGSGYLCQMEPVAHFGLGDLRHVEQVEVRWPDGAVVVIEQPPIGRLITVPYPPE